MPPTKVKQTATTSIVFGHETTVQEIRDALESIPGSAKVSVTHWRGDQRDPAQTTITARWDLS